MYAAPLTDAREIELQIQLISVHAAVAMCQRYLVDRKGQSVSTDYERGRTIKSLSECVPAKRRRPLRPAHSHQKLRCLDTEGPRSGSLTCHQEYRPRSTPCRG